MSRPKWTNSCATISNVPAAAKVAGMQRVGDAEFFRETVARAARLGTAMCANNLPDNQKKVKRTN